MKNIVSLKDKDEEDNDVETSLINITIATNGYVVTTYFNNDEELIEVYEFDNGPKLIKDLIKNLGLLGKVKLK